jgi:hypothetical protein
VRPEELLALREQDVGAERELILVHQRVTPAGRRPDKPGVVKVGLKERRRLIREGPEVRGRWTLFPRVLHRGRAGKAIAKRHSASVTLARPRRLAAWLLDHPGLPAAAADG